MLDYYAVLGVNQNSSVEEVKKAYHKLANIYHPDKNESNGEKFRQINEAYNTIIKQKKVKKSALSDLFKKYTKRIKKNITIDLTLEEALKGVSKTFQIPVEEPCDCHAGCNNCTNGYIINQIPYTFCFPKNVNKSYSIMGFYKNISLNIKVNVLPENGIKIIGNNIVLEEPINIFRAMLGGTYIIKNIFLGELEFQIPKGTISDFFKKLPNRGLRNGNIVVYFKLYFPDIDQNIIKKILDETEKSEIKNKTK